MNGPLVNTDFSDECTEISHGRRKLDVFHPVAAGSLELCRVWEKVCLLAFANFSAIRGRRDRAPNSEIEQRICGGFMKSRRMGGGSHPRHRIFWIFLLNLFVILDGWFGDVLVNACIVWEFVRKVERIELGEGWRLSSFDFLSSLWRRSCRPLPLEQLKELLCMSTQFACYGEF